jgi:methyl-accepting chemotaxis protein
VRGYVITGEDRFLEPWNDARAVFPVQAGTLERLTGDNPDELRQAGRIVRDVESYIREYATPLVSAVGRGVAFPHSVATTDEGKRRVDALRAELDGLRATERARITVRQDRADAAARRAVVGGVAGLAGSVFLVLVFTGYLTRVIVRPVRRVAGMAGRLAGGDLEARLPETGADEIGELERAFNTMGGSLEVNSPPGEGTLIVVRLPRSLD